jgi:uroporphyrinogen-III synthase
MKPLVGLTVILTRERSQARELQARLEELGAQVELCPLLEFAPPDDPAIPEEALRRLGDYDWVLFTSRNAVRCFPLPAECRPRVGAIGPGTAAALRANGTPVDLVAEEAVAEGFLAALEAQAVAGQRFLLPRAQEARDVLPEGLRARGALVDVVPVYKTVLLTGLCPSGDWVVLMSSSSARAWRQVCSDDIPCLCIGPITAAAAREAGFSRVVQADRHDEDGVVAKLLDVARK